jgi:putative transposase
LVIPKHEQRFTGFDDKMVAMYDAKLVPLGTPVREIQVFLLDQYGTEVLPD